jgi:hypothetical protein
MNHTYLRLNDLVISSIYNFYINKPRLTVNLRPYCVDLVPVDIKHEPPRVREHCRALSCRIYGSQNTCKDEKRGEELEHLCLYGTVNDERRSDEWVGGV